MLKPLEMKWLLYLLMISSLSGIEIKRIILATDANPEYIQFWPVVARAWKQMGIQPTLALVADEGVTVDETLGDVIRFPPLPGISTALQAQVIRLLLPAHFPDDFCLISDIDMVPLKRSYFVDSVKNVDKDAFVIYRDRAFGPEEPMFAMCYIAGIGSTFMSLFGIKGPEDIPSKIREWDEKKLGWCTDQKVLYQCVMDWPHSKTRCVKLGHRTKRRMDRCKWAKYEKRNIKKEDYIDAHCPRPYEKYKKSIDNLLLLQNNQSS